MTARTDTPKTAHGRYENGRLVDIIVCRNGRTLAMLGPAGAVRELGFLPGPDVLPRQVEGPPPTPQTRLPVLIGAGTGTALEAVVSRLAAAHGPDFCLAVVDKEEDILAVSDVKTRFAGYPGICWIGAPSVQEAVSLLTHLQEAQGGWPLLPLLNPFYLRLDRDFYSALERVCASSDKADFWGRARYVKFKEDAPRLLLLTSKYFLMGEIIAACERLDFPHYLLQLPEGGLGQHEFIEELLSAVLAFKPDLIFTINHLGVDREGVLTDLLERLRLPLASWFVDNPHLILFLYSRLASPWTAIFTWDTDNIASLNELGFANVSYLPLGVDVTRFCPLAAGEAPFFPGLPPEWDGKVAFVGNSMVSKVHARMHRSCLPDALTEGYQAVAAGFAAGEERSVRAFLQRSHPELLPHIDSLADAEQRLGYETMLTWEATRQYRLACIQSVMPFAPLIVGDKGWHDILPDDASWSYHAEMNYYEDLPRFYPCAEINFNCTSKQMKGAVNQRVFDVPATGSFLLTDYREQVEDLFEPGREIICYHSPEEATALAEEYLKRPDRRRAVAAAARKRILREHSYEHRVRSLVARMRELYAS